VVGALLVASGCITFDPLRPDDNVPTGSGSGSGTPVPVEARLVFTQEVHPILTALCADCHAGTGFYRFDPDAAYDVLLKDFPAYLGEPRFSQDAPLVTAPARLLQAFYTPEQVDWIFYWFALETR